MCKCVYMYVYECNICNIYVQKNTKARCLNIIHETSAILFLLLIYWDQIFIAFWQRFPNPRSCGAMTPSRLAMQDPWQHCPARITCRDPRIPRVEIHWDFAAFRCLEHVETLWFFKDVAALNALLKVQFGGNLYLLRRYKRIHRGKHKTNIPQMNGLMVIWLW